MGLTDVEMDSVLTLVLDLTHAAARGIAQRRRARGQTGINDAEWWAANAPALERIFDAERYPTASRVGTAAGQAYGGAYDPRHAFEFGLERVLDGVAALIAQR
ncbi:MAG: TetR/AcrR family transcriptional regulator C-terminal domain-containing protein [Nocardioidaceae bacterium]